MPEERGKLLPEDEAKIQKNYTFLLEELDGGSLADHLYEKGVFNTNDKDEISSQRTRREKTEMFLKLLLDSGPGKAYSVFLETLKKPYPHVAEKLEEKEIYDEETMNIIKKVFVKYIIPTNISERLYSYDVLTHEDLEVVSSRAENDGRPQGAEELLLRIAKFEKWFWSLLEVLRDPEFKLGDVLDKIWEELEKVEEKKDSINLIRNKALTAATLLERKDVFEKKHGLKGLKGLKCLKYVSQTYLDHPSLRQVIGDWLAEHRCAGTFVNILKQELNKGRFYDETVINSTLVVCLRYSQVNLNFAKSLADAGAVMLMTGIISDRDYYLSNLDSKREEQVVINSMRMLLNIAVMAGKIPSFKDSKTAEALKRLTNTPYRHIKVRAMLTLVEIVEEEDKDSLLTFTSDSIKFLVDWIYAALDSEDKMCNHFTAQDLSRYLARLAVEKNMEKITESGVFSKLLSTLRNTDSDPDKLGETAKCLGQMASNERVRQAIQDVPDLVAALMDLQKSQYANVRSGADEALMMIIDPYSSSKRPPMVQINTPKSDADVYNMNNPCRGTAIIINNKKFEEEEEERTGTDIDAENMQRLLKNQLCFENVERHNDLTAQQMTDLLFHVSKMDHSQSDCFVCIILSHGDEGGLVYGVDCKTVHMDDLRSYFKGDKCPSLVGKPKIFFIQACSGLKEDRGVTASDSQVSKVDEKAEYRIPLEADFLLAYAVVPGFLSWRDPRKGSWFIQAVVDVFTEHWTHMDLESMLIDVKGRVAKDFEGQSEDGIVKQMPSITSMLRKRVFFAIKQK